MGGTIKASSLQHESSSTANITLNSNGTTTIPSLSNSYSYKNKIINGDFRFWQRGTTGADGAYVADRWKGSYTSGGNSMSLNTDTPSIDTKYSMAIVNAGSYNNPGILQYIESLYARPLANKTVTLSFWMKMSVAGAMIVQAYEASAEDNFTTTTELLNNSSTNATTSWARYSFTFTTTNNVSNGMIVQIRQSGTTAKTIWISNVQLEEGTVATDFEYRPFDVELNMCRRYYEKSFNYDFPPANGSAANAFATNDGLTSFVCGNTYFDVSVFFKVSKRKTPVITKYGNNSGYWCVGTLSNGTPTWTQYTYVTTRGREGFGINQQETGAWVLITGHWAANAEF